MRHVRCECARHASSKIRRLSRFLPFVSPAAFRR
jgi:hypothetical protein